MRPHQQELPALTDQDRQRYARQLMIPGWGEDTQRRLSAFTVLIAGAGGLGSTVAIALAVAGVGTLRLCDFDVPELSNLNRRLLHDEPRVGMNRTESGKLTVTKLNPHVRVEAIPVRIDQRQDG
jgi:molybdopterin/thiamine biosynthesis adenylyltransferase